MTRLVEVIVGSVVGGLVALAVIVPQLGDAHAATVRADHDRALMERVCTFYVNGSATCPAGTFEVGARR